MVDILLIVIVKHSAQKNQLIKHIYSLLSSIIFHLIDNGTDRHSGQEYNMSMTIYENVTNDVWMAVPSQGMLRPGDKHFALKSLGNTFASTGVYIALTSTRQILNSSPLWPTKRRALLNGFFYQIICFIYLLNWIQIIRINRFNAWVLLIRGLCFIL